MGLYLTKRVSQHVPQTLDSSLMALLLSGLRHRHGAPRPFSKSLSVSWFASEWPEDKPETCQTMPLTSEAYFR